MNMINDYRLSKIFAGKYFFNQINFKFLMKFLSNSIDIKSNHTINISRHATLMCYHFEKFLLYITM